MGDAQTTMTTKKPLNSSQGRTSSLCGAAQMTAKVLAAFGVSEPSAWIELVIIHNWIKVDECSPILIGCRMGCSWCRTRVSQPVRSAADGSLLGYRALLSP